MTALCVSKQHSQQDQLRFVQAQAKVEGDLKQSLALLNASQQRLTILDVEKEVWSAHRRVIESAAHANSPGSFRSQVTSSRESSKYYQQRLRNYKQRHTDKQRDLQNLDKLITRAACTPQST